MNAKATTLLAALDGLPPGATVVEIGCVRFDHEVASDGWSTVHLARECARNGWLMHSVDVDPEAVEFARHAVAGLVALVHWAEGAEWLAEFPGPIDALYLDGSADPEQACAQYAAANLSPTAVIVIDDVQPIGDQRRGKGDLLLDRLETDGFTVNVFDTEPGYRMAVAKIAAIE